VGFDFPTLDEFEREKPSITEALTVTPVQILKNRFNVDLSVPLTVEFSS
jgi:hypothetical protein